MEQAELPAGWRWVRLGEVATLNPARPSLGCDADSPTPFIPMSAVLEGGRGIAVVALRPYAEVRQGYTYFAPGDVLFAKITPCMQNRKHAVVPSLEAGFGFGSTEFHVIRPSATILAEWARFFLLQPSVLRDAEAHFSGAVGQQRVPEGWLASLPIPLPPLAEQQRIAAILQRQMAAVGRARAAAEAQMAAARALPAAYLRQVFESEEAKGWPRRKLGEVCDFLDGRRIPVNDTERQRRIRGKPQEELYPYYGANGQVGWIDGYLFDEPLILLAEDGGAFGSATKSIAYGISGRAWVNNHAHVLRPRPAVDYDYCLLVLAIRPDVGDLITGSTRGKLNQEVAAGIYLPLPPLCEQRRIAGILQRQMAAVERAREAVVEQMAELDRLPGALLRRAFGGGL